MSSKDVTGVAQASPTISSLEVLKTVASRLEKEPIAKVADRTAPIGGSQDTANPLLCPDCNKAHIPRRIVCCVDGTWMAPDGAAGNEQGNASNIFRIWASVKDGVVKDENEQSWYQIRKYFRGIGAELDLIPRIYTGITGSGFEVLIFKVYKFCALNCCPSRDEIYLFGFSRGAYVVRAVAALFHHMRTLDPKLDVFDDLYWDSLRIYRRSRDKKAFHQHETYHHLVEHTLAPAPVKFVGVIDTVKAVDDAWLYDIEQTPNTTHVRHALAILEVREAFLPERYRQQSKMEKGSSEESPINEKLYSLQLGQGQTCIEAWFLGSHGNLGGSLTQDGLSLWPLQFMLSEAQSSGLVLEFQPVDSVEIQNPLEYAMPAPSNQRTGVDSPRMPQSIPYRNGAVVKMWDLRDVFTLIPGLEPFVNVAKSKMGPLFDEERTIQGLTNEPHEGGFNAIIHPSVYFHDDWSPLGLYHINDLNGRHQIRKYRKNIALPWDELFWNQSFRQRVDLTLQNPRVLVVGGHGSGKSTLINAVAKANISDVNSSMTSTDHDIYRELQGSGSEFIFHDSQGWDSGSDKPYLTAHEFLESCRGQPAFAQQLHCIWYCMEVSQTRINTIDKEFFKGVDFEGVTLVVVFTKCDRLFAECHADAISEYENENDSPGSLDPMFVPPELQTEITGRRAAIYEAKKAAHGQKVMTELGQEFQCVFVRRRQDMQQVEALIALTKASRSSLGLRRIHNRAIKSHLAQILPIACAKAALLKPKTVILPWKATLGSREDIENDIKVSAEAFMLPLFRLKLAQDAHFKDVSEMFSSVDAKRKATIEGLWTSYSFNPGARLLGGIGARALLGVVLGPVALLGALAYGTTQEIATNFHRNKAVLMELVLLLLANDRMVWFGSQEISREMAARAWIEALRSLPDVESKLQKDLSIFSSDDWKELLLGVVSQFKFDGESL